MPLLQAENVSKHFVRRGVLTQAVRNVSLSVEEAETLGIIGESGSGKSTLGRLLLGLIRPDTGSIVFDGVEISSLSRRRLRSAMRGRQHGMQAVFQEPFESLNPRLPIGRSVGEPLEINGPLSRRELGARVAGALEEAGLPAAYAVRYPVELSGGEQQRVGIARAMIVRPSLVVLDEPTSSLDVSVQADILDLLRNLQRDHGVAYVFVSHDFGVIEAMTSRVLVMYHGEVIESGPTESVLCQPSQPYTQALVSMRLRPVPRPMNSVQLSEAEATI